MRRTYYQPPDYEACTTTTGPAEFKSIRYAGQPLDAGTGLMYYEARYYDPVLSHFISADPTTPDASNPIDYHKYLYTHGNPLRYVDTSGYGPDDYYVFVYGCSNVFGTAEGCEPPPSDFNEYEEGIHDLYNGWKAEQHRQNRLYGESDYAPIAPWHKWKQKHILPVAAPSAAEGAAKLESTLASIPNDGGDIHLWGHSLGGTAILHYLGTKYAEDYLGYKVRPPVDSRIASVALIDSQLQAPDGGTGNFAKWLYANTRVRPGALLQVTSTNSVFPTQTCITGFDCREASYTGRTVAPGPPPIPGFPDPDTRKLWHDYTYRRLVGSNYESWFMTYWR